MSAAQSQSTLESKLETLQCHFTWDLVSQESKLFRLRDKLEDIGTEGGHQWLGHIYNLQGYIHYQLDKTEDALSFFNKATEAFRQMRNADDGPWLVVNYGNLAWLHHHLGDQTESQAYLLQVDALMTEYPPSAQDELHAEIYAEKAWSLASFRAEQRLLAGDYYQRAIEMQPNMVEWKTCHVLLLVDAFQHNREGLDAVMLERMRIAKEEDPENLYLAMKYIEERAKIGERIEDEAREMARRILRNPVSSYSGIRVLLWVYKSHVSIADAVDLIEEALENHPDERYLKRCAALCYKWRIFFVRDDRPQQSVIDRAISVLREVISLYPHSSFVKKLDLANILAKSNRGLDEADQIYQELLDSELKPVDKKVLYNYYAKYLHFQKQDQSGSINYHMRAAEIEAELQCFYGESFEALRKIRDGGRNRRWREIDEFLKYLQRRWCYDGRVLQRAATPLRT